MAQLEPGAENVRYLCNADITECMSARHQSQQARLQSFASILPAGTPPVLPDRREGGLA
jgi:hypothetical protein